MGDWNRENHHDEHHDTIQSLTEENERLKAAYARLAERLRLATPHSLYAQTEQDIELQSTVDKLRAALEVLAAEDGMWTAMGTRRYARHALESLSSTENREPE